MVNLYVATPAPSSDRSSSLLTSELMHLAPRKRALYWRTGRQVQPPTEREIALFGLIVERVGHIVFSEGVTQSEEFDLFSCQDGTAGYFVGDAAMVRSPGLSNASNVPRSDGD